MIFSNKLTKYLIIVFTAAMMTSLVGCNDVKIQRKNIKANHRRERKRLQLKSIMLAVRIYFTTMNVFLNLTAPDFLKRYIGT